MTKKLTIFIATLALSTTAFAQQMTGNAAAGSGSDSSLFFQPDGGRQSAKLSLDFGMRSPDLIGGAGTAKRSDFGVGLQYLFGVNNDWAVGVERIGFMTRSLDVTPTGLPTVTSKASGLEDIQLAARGTYGMGAFNLHVGSLLGISPGKSKADAVQSGGLSLTPYVGATLPVGPGLLGARISYRLNMERESDTGVKTTGGNVLGLNGFYEWHMGNLFVIPMIGVAMTGETTATPTPAGGNASSMTSTNFGVEGGWYIMPDTVLGASYMADMMPESTAQGTKSFTAHTISVFGRIEM